MGDGSTGNRPDVAPVKGLDDIWFFIAADNVTAADTLLDEIAAGSAMLAANPFLGRARPELAAELRSFLVRNWVL